MKPSAFEYHRVGAIDEAIALLERYEGDAKILAGGQSLMPIMNMRLARPSALIDLDGVPNLAGIRVVDDRLVIGAMTRHAQVERSEIIRRSVPILAEAMRYVGHLAIRTRGTFGGSIAHADPAAELPAMCTLLDARLTIAGRERERVVGWQDFFLSYLATCMEPTEILTEISLEIPAPGTGWSFREVARRHGDYALVGIGSLVSFDGGGAIEAARIALFGVSSTPVRLIDAEAALKGLRPDDPQVAGIAQRAVADLEPNGDVHASAEYRRGVAQSLVADAVTAAAKSRPTQDANA